MTEPKLAPAQRRILAWGFVLLALAVGAGVSLALVKRAFSGAFFGRSEPVMTQELVVERLREVAKLVSSEMTLRDVVTYEQTQFHSTKRTLLVVTARVSAGIDLRTNTEVHIDSAAKRIVISLPPAQIMGVDVVNMTTYDEHAGLWNPFTTEDRDVIQGRIRAQFLSAARQSGILQHADESAMHVLTDLLTRDGYTVEIKRPMVIVKPTG
ncbi:MAG: DUF4230 domain-containing protein [Gemmatimonadota bacterium]|nr:DUF4230 domain-containing protein [Gemmatimonadota bacterium]